MDFEWDFIKEQANILKHGCTFYEAVDSFNDPHGIVLTDDAHSKKEERLYWVGKTSDGRILTTRFTRRGNKIRIIGCADWRKFRRLYNEATKTR